MPLTPFQASLARLLSKNRSPDSYLAGGAAIHLEPNTSRYSNDLDYFQDSAERVAEAYDEDRKLLLENGYRLSVDIQCQGTRSFTKLVDVIFYDPVSWVYGVSCPCMIPSVPVG